MTKYPNGYTDKQIIKKLNEFGNLGFVTIKWYSPNHNDLNYAVDVTVLKDGINYFADKKKNRTSSKRDRKSTRLNSSHTTVSRMPSSA